MAIEVLLRSLPYRAIALKTTSHALVLRHSAPSTSSTIQSSLQVHKTGGQTARCIVDFSKLDNVDLTGYLPLSSLPVQGTLGLITIESGIFLCVVTSSTHVATVRPGETVQRIDAVEFCQSAFRLGSYYTLY